MPREPRQHRSCASRRTDRTSRRLCRAIDHIPARAAMHRRPTQWAEHSNDLRGAVSCARVRQMSVVGKSASVNAKGRSLQRHVRIDAPAEDTASNIRRKKEASVDCDRCSITVLKSRRDTGDRALGHLILVNGREVPQDAFKGSWSGEENASRNFATACQVARDTFLPRRVRATRTGEPPIARPQATYTAGRPDSQLRLGLLPKYTPSVGQHGLAPPRRLPSAVVACSHRKPAS